MNKKSQRLLRRGPDLITEELVAVLADGTWFEFKPLFLLVLNNLRARNAARGDGEMLRLRAYEKLHQLVAKGIVEKNGKEYRANGPALVVFRDHLAAQHCQNLLQIVASTPEADIRDPEKLN